MTSNLAALAAARGVSERRCIALERSRTGLARLHLGQHADDAVNAAAAKLEAALRAAHDAAEEAYEQADAVLHADEHLRGACSCARVPAVPT